MIKLYRLLSAANDVKAVSKGRIVQRSWNKLLLKFIRRFMK